MPTDSGAFRSQFCGREIVNAVLIVGGVAFEGSAHTASHSARTPPERHAPASVRNIACNDKVSLTVTLPHFNWEEIRGLSIGSRCKRSRTTFVPQSVLVSL